MAAIAYRCSNCGSERVAVDPSRPSLDDRYAIGQCETENAKADAAKRTRKKVELIRADLYDHVRAQREKKAATERRARAAKAASVPGKEKVSVERMAEGRRVVEELYR